MSAQHQSLEKVDEHNESLWALTLSPLVWAAHFLASYLTNAIYCAKFANESGDASPVQWAIFAYTAIALAVILAIGGWSFRRHRLGKQPLPHDQDTSEDRHRFLGFACLLLSILSAVAVLFTALVAVLIGNCR